MKQSLNTFAYHHRPNWSPQFYSEDGSCPPNTPTPLVWANIYFQVVDSRWNILEVWQFRTILIFSWELVGNTEWMTFKMNICIRHDTKHIQSGWLRTAKSQIKTSTNTKTATCEHFPQTYHPKARLGSNRWLRGGIKVFRSVLPVAYIQQTAEITGNCHNLIVSPQTYD